MCDFSELQIHQATMGYVLEEVEILFFSNYCFGCHENVLKHFLFQFLGLLS